MKMRRRRYENPLAAWWCAWLQDARRVRRSIDRTTRRIEALEVQLGLRAAGWIR